MSSSGTDEKQAVLPSSGGGGGGGGGTLPANNKEQERDNGAGSGGAAEGAEDRHRQKKQRSQPPLLDGDREQQEQGKGGGNGDGNEAMDDNCHDGTTTTNGSAVRGETAGDGGGGGGVGLPPKTCADVMSTDSLPTLPEDQEAAVVLPGEESSGNAEIFISQQQQHQRPKVVIVDVAATAGSGSGDGAGKGGVSGIVSNDEALTETASMVSEPGAQAPSEPQQLQQQQPPAAALPAAEKQQQQQSSRLLRGRDLMSRMVSQDFSNCEVDEDAISAAANASRSTSFNDFLSVTPPSGTSRKGSPVPTRPPLPTVTTTTTKPSSRTGKAKAPLPHIPAAAPRITGKDDEELYPDRIRLGICAMDKKARSKPMAEILSRLDESLFQVVFFGDDLIINSPIEDWPVCDVLIAFFSKGYPLHKAKEYVALRKPFILNDLEMQQLLQDRRRVYDLLEASGIDVPRHAYLSRDGYVSTGTGDGNGNRDTEVIEYDDSIEVNGISIHKPFVEKPVDAEDHNIAIYYPTSAGGGCKKLFRKIGNRSSEFYPGINEVRRDGSFIYEEFVETQGTDVKMYTVGPEYGHAEARKSPTVDGKVERNSDGKEVRFPVILNLREKEIARRIVLVFKQFVCGFDILRVQEGHSVVSYVCDVNGWSFVKNSRKYYDDCSQILSEHIIALVKPAALTAFSTLDPLMTTNLNRLDEDIPEGGDNASIASYPRRKGHERKDTLLTRAARMLGADPDDTHDDDLNEDGTNSGDNVSPPREVQAAGAPSLSPSKSDTVEVLKSAAATLSEGALPVRDLPNQLTSQPASLIHSDASSLCDDKEAPRSHGSVSGKHRSSNLSQGCHQEELRCVLAIVRHGDRTPKQKLKVNMTEPHILKFFHDHVKDCRKDLKVKAKAPMTEFLRTVKTTLSELEKGPETDNLRHQLMHMRDILERWKIVGLNRKLQIKPRKFEDYEDGNGETKQRCKEVQLILKWGGNLTKLGEKQSIVLGKRFRHEMYPDAPGGGILRLHSTFRHDLKIKTSDEGRVMKTAAAFAKGLLELEGDLPPILVSLVHKEKGSMHMLDPSGNKEVKMELDECKERITANLQRDIETPKASEEELEQLVGPKELTAMRDALIGRVVNPRKALHSIHQTMGELIAQLEEMLEVMGSGDEKRIEGGEGLRGETDDDVALSGVKLYKGETLLELTERWRFIHDRLYDAEEDKFDLSRIPDVHDNVRFDVLHNPHLGLSATLHKLYSQAKAMADCVVPQEYGTTVEEKRTIGGKICHGLLEKIKYDLVVARTDNNTDMRYLINMDYSLDLPINTMGRRIRTRMYFTSESHLHTVLNVLRYAECDNGTKSLLSEHGKAIINAAPEICYLTQIVMRVFEDSRRDVSDPRRFRVELLFSPGATATPFHMDELARQSDSSRFDTAPLQRIGRDDLTCQDVEKFFDITIMAGRSDEEFDDVASTSAYADDSILKKIASSPSPSTTGEPTPSVAGKSATPAATSTSATGGDATEQETPDSPKLDRGQQKEAPTSAPSEPSGKKTANTEMAPKNESPKKTNADTDPSTPVDQNKDENGESRAAAAAAAIDLAQREDDTMSRDRALDAGISKSTEGVPPPRGGGDDGKGNGDSTSPDSGDGDSGQKVTRTVVARKYFWSTVAVSSFVLGMGCLAMALRLSEDSRQRRRWSRRY